MVAVLGQVSVYGVAAHMVQIQVLGAKQWVLGRAAAHHDRDARLPGAFLFPEERRPASFLCSGKRTNSRWVRSTTFQVTVSPGFRSRAEAKGRGILAYTCTVPPWRRMPCKRVEY